MKLHDLIAYDQKKLNLTFVVDQTTRSINSLLSYYYSFQLAKCDAQSTPFSSYYKSNLTLQTKNAIYIVNDPKIGLFQQVPLTFASYQKMFYEVSVAYINSRFLPEKAIFNSFTAIIGTSLDYNEQNTTQFLLNINQVVDSIKIRKLKLYTVSEYDQKVDEIIDDQRVEQVYSQLPDELKEKVNITQFRQIGEGLQQFLKHQKGESEVEKPTKDSLVNKLRNKVKKDEL